MLYTCAADCWLIALIANIKHKCSWSNFVIRAMLVSTCCRQSHTSVLYVSATQRKQCRLAIKSTSTRRCLPAKGECKLQAESAKQLSVHKDFVSGFSHTNIPVAVQTCTAHPDTSAQSLTYRIACQHAVEVLFCAMFDCRQRCLRSSCKHHKAAHPDVR